MTNVSPKEIYDKEFLHQDWEDLLSILWALAKLILWLIAFPFLIALACGFIVAAVWLKVEEIH